ncbi:MAG: hypothetical protein IT385_01370 [Deltaproteobacteria bacterium]|nr:hypothetical protein [Deltaproteobacteria bacterium]
MRGWARREPWCVMVFAAGALGACDEERERQACGPDEVRIADRCVFAGDADATTGDVGDTSGDDTPTTTDAATDATTAATDTTATATDATTTDATTTDSGDTGPVGPALPFFVDAYYVMSGYMGSGAVDVADCGAATPADTGAGACFKITWTPASGTTADWTGFYFQYPENNWGDAPGLDLPPGAERVSFRAWGDVAGVSANFAVGIQAADGFQIESGYQTLGTTPLERSISLAGRTYTDVAGAFAWFLDNPKAQGEVVLYLDDIQWIGGGGGGSGCTDPDATNFDSAATVDDGSCTFAVTFAVDMGCPDPDTAFETVWLTGPFCSWCGDGFPLTDGDADGVYTGTFPLPSGDLEHKFMTNGFASQEDLIDDVAAGQGGCAPVTDGATYANRRVRVGDAPQTFEAVYGRCGACP